MLKCFLIVSGPPGRQRAMSALQQVATITLNPIGCMVQSAGTVWQLKSRILPLLRPGDSLIIVEVDGDIAHC